jgi:hypothetical protein
MRHNTYAVPENFYGRIEAQYEVYLGRSDNGTPLVDPNGVSLYQSAFVTFAGPGRAPCYGRVTSTWIAS